jgi:hypothetical protein
MVRPCISKHRAISEGLNDRAADQQAKIEADEAFADEVVRELHEAFLAEEAAATRQSIIDGVDPISGMMLTRRQHMLAVEHLDPPMTYKEKAELELYYCVVDDGMSLDRRLEEHLAWDQTPNA